MKDGKYEEMRVYVVVPGIVQTPIKMTSTPRQGVSILSAGRFENTRDIVQPAGRQAMQIGHVRAMVEHDIIMRQLAKMTHRGRMAGERRFDQIIQFNGSLHDIIPYHAITGIAKACRDSFELIHVAKLLHAAGIKYFEFHDTQEGLYENVVTALATEPVHSFAITGILDYLPLWGLASS